MKTRFQKSILPFFCVIFLSLKCCEDPVKPSDEVIKNPRDYTWTIDTISYPGSIQTIMQNSWGISPTDLFLVGSNDQPGAGTMYHFDGYQWSTTGFHASEGGGIGGSVDLSAIFGFSATDIYVAGSRLYSNQSPPPNILDSSLIIHFDGSNWMEISLTKGRYLSTIWGDNNQDIWAGGGNGTLYHLIGGTWNKLMFDSLTWIANISGFSTSDVYFSAIKEDYVRPHDSLTYQMWHYDGIELALIDSYLITVSNLQRKFGCDLWQSDGNLYSSDYGVYKFESGQWHQILSNDSPLRMGGGSSKNIFALGDFGKIFHWNGSEWLRMSSIENPNVQYSSVWADNHEAFIIGHDGGRTYVLHGK